MTMSSNSLVESHHGNSDVEITNIEDPNMDQSDLPLDGEDQKGKELFVENVSIHDAEEAKEEYSGNHNHCSAIIERLQVDKCYRQKVILSLLICWSFVFLGWLFGQFGPAFLDLQHITSVGLEKGAGFLTATSCGYLAGTLISGIVHDKANPLFILFSVVFFNSLVVIAIPFCSKYELMVVAQSFRGLFGGGLDACGNALMVETWSGEGHSFMQALHFSYAVGGIISPLATAPFLLETNNDLATTENKSDFSNITFATLDITNNSILDVFETITMTIGSNTTMKTTAQNYQESQLYKAFFLTGAMGFSASLCFFIYLVKPCRNNGSLKTEVGKSVRKRRDLPLKSNILSLVVMSLLFSLYCAVENSFNAFLTTFCVKQLSWTKTNGSIVTAMFWAAYGFGRFLGIFMVKFVKPATLLGAFYCSLEVTFTGFLLSALNEFDVGIWIFSILAGLGMSIIFPTMFTWTEEKLLPVTGKVASLFLIAATAGSMINPLVLGYLMDKLTPMWFVYILLAESIFVFLIFLLLLFMSKSVVCNLQ